MKKRTLGMVFSSLIVSACPAGCAKNEENAIVVQPEALLSESSKQPP